MARYLTMVYLIFVVVATITLLGHMARISANVDYKDAVRIMFHLPIE